MLSDASLLNSGRIVPVIAAALWAGMLAMPSSAQESVTQAAQADADTRPSNFELPRRLQDSGYVDPSTDWVPTLTRRDRSAELERKIAFGNRALEAGKLTSPAHYNALLYFSIALEIDPEDPRARAGIQKIAVALLRQTEEAIEAGDPDLALDLLNQAEELQAEPAAVAELRAELTRNDELADLLAKARSQIDQDRLTAPEGDNALATLEKVLALEPENETAAAAMAEIEAKLIERTTVHLDTGDYTRALASLDTVGMAFGESPAVNQIRIQVLSERQALWDAKVGDVTAAIEANRLDEAEAGIAQLVESGYDGSVAMLSSRLQEMRILNSYRPGDVLRDALRAGDPAPTMIVIGQGSFRMGSPPGEAGRRKLEGPIQNITFSHPFAVSQREVTVAEFRRFVEATNYVTDAEKAGSSKIYDASEGELATATGVDWRRAYDGGKADDDLPVVHVSWNDAAAYAAWLSEQTGRSYRLPSEAEFEYALRAGSTSPYWWGDGSPRNRVENLPGERDRIRNLEWPESFDGYGDGNWGPARAGSFDANPFGLHDIGGNVMEWVGDCYQPTLSGVPLDGSVRLTSNCQGRVIKGGSWASKPRFARSAHRMAGPADATNCMLGFRLARDLYPPRRDAGGRLASSSTQ